jgi:hypothetical protein
MEYLLLKTIGIDLTLKCVNIVSTSVHSIYNLVSAVKASGANVIEITKLLKELDIDNDVILIESLLQEIDLTKIHSKTLAICLERLKECVLEIENDLKIINDRLTYNNSLWYGKSFRAYAFDDKIESLKLLKLNLDNRKKNLFEIIKINNYLN